MVNKIGWCDDTWNPVVGCMNKCPYCYAKKISHRFAKQFSKSTGISQHLFEEFTPVWMEKNFNKRFSSKSTHIFVNSMSDVSYWRKDWLRKVLLRADEMRDKQFMFLTKNYETTLSRFSQMSYLIGDNVHLGFTVTCQKDVDQLKVAVEKYSVPFKYFISVEPIHGYIDLDGFRFDRISQIIVGAESGNRKGKIVPELRWVSYFSHLLFHKNRKLFDPIKLYEKDSLSEVIGGRLVQQRI